ncbi:MAG: ParA family protein [Gammaproteobacteria bacterium]|nr:ParA family protein [Gammaproteobacteria bacterium]
MRPLMRIVVINSKGGCGKTTLCTNLAGYYAARGYRTALLDADVQGSSLQWLKNRGDKHATVTGIAGCERQGRVTRSFQMRVPPDTERLIVDTPAALDSLRLQEFTRDADAILIPVLPSDIDIHAASRCIADLLLVGRIERRAERVAVIANRVKKNTLIYERLQLFLRSLDIPFVASLRDTQNYVHAAEAGLAIHELESYKARADMHDWRALIHWLEQRPLLGANPGVQAIAQAPAR